MLYNISLLNEKIVDYSERAGRDVIIAYHM
jgi:hypothetical protein